MADYLIKGETLTNIADEVRELSGTTIPKTTSSMLSDINAANTEISSQSDIIDQILSAVDELPEAGGGSGGGNSVELAEVSVSVGMLGTSTIHYLNDKLQYATVAFNGNNPETTFSVVKNSIIILTEKPQSQTGNLVDLYGAMGIFPYVITGNASFNWM